LLFARVAVTMVVAEKSVKAKDTRTRDPFLWMSLLIRVAMQGVLPERHRYAAVQRSTAAKA
jgi:hypothetical protein